MTDHIVATVDELEDGDRKTVQLEGREITVFNTESEYYAYTNWCPHQSGSVCEGKVSGTREASFDNESLRTTVEWTRNGKVLNCPWHGWEFNIQTGACLSRREVKLISHDVSVEQGNIVLSL